MPHPSKIDESQRKEEIVDLLSEGWSARRIRKYLVDRYGETSDLPSVRTIERYREANIDPTAILSAKAVTQALRKLGNGVAEISTLDVLIRAEEQRIASMWYRELENDTVEPTFNDAIRVTTELIRLRFQIAQQLGIARRGKDGQVKLKESRAMELPEESFHEILTMLRNRREEAKQPPLAPRTVEG